MFKCDMPTPMQWCTQMDLYSGVDRHPVMHAVVQKRYVISMLYTPVSDDLIINYIKGVSRCSVKLRLTITVS